MKRILCVLLALALCLSFVSCKPQDVSVNGNGESPNETTPQISDYEKAVELLGSPEATPISQNPSCHIFKIEETGVQVRYNADATTQKVYDLITKNADVVRGVFTGHLHYDYYVDIPLPMKRMGRNSKPPFRRWC